MRTLKKPLKAIVPMSTVGLLKVLVLSMFFVSLLFLNSCANLIDAAKKGDTADVKTLLNKGADANAKDKGGWTALMEASQNGHTEIVNALLNKGADVNAKFNNSWTALMFASEKGHTEIVKALIAKGADVNAKLNDGYTALMFASAEGHTEIVKTLLNKGADVNVKDKGGRTALMRASEKGYTETVKALLDKGAYVNAKDDSVGIFVFIFLTGFLFMGSYLVCSGIRNIFKMDEKGIEKIRKNMEAKSSYELLKIWVENDRERYYDEAFEAVKQVLLKRGETIPPQGDGTASDSLPKEIKCPHCSAVLELEEDERKTGKITCPECNKIIVRLGGAIMAKVKWLPTILLTLIFFAIFEFVVYRIFGDIFQQWVWWFKLPAAAAEKQNPVLNIIVIVKILFGFAVLVILPLVGSLVLAEKVVYGKKERPTAHLK